MGTEFRDVKEVFIHPQYNDPNFDYDFALLHLEQPSSIEPVIIDKEGVSDSYETDLDILWTAGFGQDENDQFSDSLQEVDLAYVEPSDCVQPVSDYKSSDITENMMCAAAVGKDS